MPLDPDNPAPLLVALVFVAVLVVARYLLSATLRRVFAYAAHLSGRLTPENRLVRMVLRGEVVLAARFPTATGFVRRRLSPRSFSGLPLTALMASAAVMALLFSEVTEEVLERGDIEALDSAVLESMSAVRSRLLVAVFAWLTQAGDNMTLGVAAAVTAALLWAHGQRPLVMGLFVTVAGSQTMLWIAKFTIDRARPDFLVGVTAASPSFPSGHATGAMAIYGFIAYAASRSFSSGAQRFEIAFWAGVFILLIGFSRILLHVHYPSDVVAGYLAGSLWLIVGAAVTEWAAQTSVNGRGGHGTR